MVLNMAMDTNQTAVQKKYWNDEIKGMLGPCMITFSIPLTIPGLTITLVAFSKDTTFQLYGTLHIVGILFLAVAIILIILGCILRVLWKPFIGPDIEMHLSPNPSVVNVRSEGRRNQTDRMQAIYTGESQSTSRVSPYPANDSNRFTDHRKPSPLTSAMRNEFSKSELKSEKRLNNAIRKTTDTNASAHNSSCEGTGSETESTTILSHVRKHQTDFRSPRGSRHLMELNKNKSSTSRSKTLNESDGTLQNDLPLEDIQQWRSSKRKKRKSKEKMDGGQMNTANDCEDKYPTTTSLPIPKVKVDGPPNSETLSVPSEKQDQGNSTGDDNMSGSSSKSPRQSLLPNVEADDRKRKKKRKKKKVLASLKQDSVESNNVENKPSEDASSSKLPTLESGNKNALGRENSSDSLGSIGSVDSVLAQYTSRDNNR